MMISKQHKSKYKNFIKACKQKTAPYIIVSDLEIIGDTVDEIKQNLELLREHNKKLVLANRDMVLSFSRGLYE